MVPDVICTAVRMSRGHYFYSLMPTGLFFIPCYCFLLVSFPKVLKHRSVITEPAVAAAGCVSFANHMQSISQQKAVRSSAGHCGFPCLLHTSHWTQPLVGPWSLCCAEGEAVGSAWHSVGSAQHSVGSAQHREPSREALVPSRGSILGWVEAWTHLSPGSSWLHGALV